MNSYTDKQGCIVISNDKGTSLQFSQLEILDLHEWATSTFKRLNEDLDQKENQFWCAFNSKVRRAGFDGSLSVKAYNTEVTKIYDQVKELRVNTKAAGRIGRFQIEARAGTSEVSISDGSTMLVMPYATLNCEYESVIRRRRDEQLQRRFELFGAVGLVGSH